MATHADVARFRANWQGEVDAAATYRTLAELEKQPSLAEVYQRLATVEEAHAQFWEEKLLAGGHAVPARRPTFRARANMWLARKLGPQAVLPTLSAKEQVASHGYDHQPDAQAVNMPAEEHSHARVLRAIAHSPGKGMEGGSLARLEGRHRAVGGNALRAAVLGANDGLVSNLSLVMGVAGAMMAERQILIAGLAGLLAGACSMAMGEWLSVQSSRELAQRQIAIESDELKESPQEEQEELSLIYQAKGLDKQEADSLAAKLIADSDNALDTLVREELGLDPQELTGSAWEAAITSFVLFVGGAIVRCCPSSSSGSDGPSGRAWPSAR